MAKLAKGKTYRKIVNYPDADDRRGATYIDSNGKMMEMTRHFKTTAFFAFGFLGGIKRSGYNLLFKIRCSNKFRAKDANERKLSTVA